MTTLEKQNIFEKYFILFFAFINGLLVAFPGIYSREFTTIFDLVPIFQDNNDFSFWKYSSILLFLTSFALIVSIPFKLHSTKSLVWEWYVYVFFNLFIVDIVALYTGENTEKAGFETFSNISTIILIIIFLIQLFACVGIFIIQVYRDKNNKEGELVLGVMSIDKIKLDPGETEIRRSHASKMFGYAGVLILTSQRLIFSGKSVFGSKIFYVSIPFEKIIHIKKPRSGSFLLTPALKIEYIDQNNKNSKITLGSELFNISPDHISEINSFFDVIYRTHNNKGQN